MKRCKIVGSVRLKVKYFQESILSDILTTELWLNSHKKGMKYLCGSNFNMQWKKNLKEMPQSTFFDLVESV